MTPFTICDQLQILEVDPWTRTPILVDIGTFAVQLSTWLLIETHVKGVPHTRSDKYDVRRLVYIAKRILVQEILVPKKPSIKKNF